MTARGWVNGVEVVYVDGAWRWADTLARVEETLEKRACPYCGELPGPNAEDGCLGHIPGVLTACCGHGERDGYIIFENGRRIDFRLTRKPSRASPSELIPGRDWVVEENGNEIQLQPRRSKHGA